MYLSIFVLFMFLSAHFIGDYVFQTPYIAEMKKVSLYHLFSHGVMYTSAFVIISFMLGEILGLPIVLGLLSSHLIIDYWKCRVGHRKFTYIIDQSLHLIIVVIVTHLFIK